MRKRAAGDGTWEVSSTFGTWEEECAVQAPGDSWATRTPGVRREMDLRVCRCCREERVRS